MRASVYRNLDKPFQVLGLNVMELIAAAAAFVLSSEVVDLFNWNRAWAMAATILLIVAMYGLRRSLGELFLRRLIRFLGLPGSLQSKMMVLKEPQDHV